MQRIAVVYHESFFWSLQQDTHTGLHFRLSNMRKISAPKWTTYPAWCGNSNKTQRTILKLSKNVTRVHKRSIWDVENKFIVATCFCNKTIFLNLKNGKMYLVHSNKDKLVMFEIFVIKSCNAKRIKREI